MARCGWLWGPVDKEGWSVARVRAAVGIGSGGYRLDRLAINPAGGGRRGPDNRPGGRPPADEVSTALPRCSAWPAVPGDQRTGCGVSAKRIPHPEAGGGPQTHLSMPRPPTRARWCRRRIWPDSLGWSSLVLLPMFNQNGDHQWRVPGHWIPTPSYVNAITTLFIDPVVSNPVVKALVTPEELYPITGVKSPALQTSVQ